MHCSHVGSDGTRCGAPEQFVDRETGFCRAHGPGSTERMASLGRKGAEAMAKRLRGGLAAAEFGTLTTPKDAERWLEVVGRAVATGRLGHAEGRTVVSGVREWLRAHEAGHVAERLEELAGRLEQLRGGSVRRLK